MVVDSIVAGGDVYVNDDARRPDDVCPYPGLLPFGEAQAQWFTGRDGEIASLVQRISSHPFTAVVGPSGVGKSSLVRAGVLPRLRDGSFGVMWEVRELDPSHHLAAVLGALDVSGPTIVWIDQAELLLQGGFDPAETLDALARMPKADDRAPRHVVIAFRSDFQSLFEPCRSLMTLIDANVERIGPLDALARRAVIEQPAARAGLRIQDGLVERILGDVGGDPASLPLLAFALEKTWERRFNNELTIVGYRASGGVERAVEQQAEIAYGSLDEGGRAFAAWAFRMRLTHQGVGPEPTRRRATMDELLTGPDGAEHMVRVVKAFEDARLLNRPGADEGTIEICHEALLRAWRRLAGWLGADRELRLLGSWLSEATADWVAADHAEEALRPEPRAQRAAEAVDRQLLAVTDDESAFLTASLDLHRATRMRERRFRQLRVVALVTVVLLAAAAVVVYVTIRSLQQSNELADVTENLRLAAAAKADASTNRDRASLLAVEASRREPLVDGQAALVDVLAAPGPSAYLAGRDGLPATDLAVLADGDQQIAVVADGRESIRLFDVATGEEMTEPLVTGVEPSERLAVPPAGDRIVVAAGGGQVAVVDPSSRQATVLPGGAPDRIIAVTAAGSAVAALDIDGAVTTWKDQSVEPVTTRPFGETATSSIAFGSDGRLLVGSMTGQLAWWDPVTGALESLVVTVSRNPVYDVAARRIGDKDVALALGTGELVVWDGLVEPVAVSAGPISSLDWFDDHTALVGRADGSVVTIDLSAGVTTGSPRRGHHSVVTAVIATPSGATLSLDARGQGITWAIDGRSPLAVVGPTVDGQLRSVTAGPTGATPATDRTEEITPGALVIAAADGVHRDTVDGELLIPVPADTRIAVLATNPAGAVGVGLEDGTVLLRQPAGDVSSTLRLDTGPVTALAVSPDGRRVAAAAMDPRDSGAPMPIQLWDLIEGRSTMITGHDLYVSALSFSPDGSLLASGSDDRTVRIWTAEGSPRSTLEGHTDMVLALQWIGDDRLVSGGQDGTVRLWDVPGGRAIGGALASGVDGPVVDAMFDEGRSQLVVAQGRSLVTWPIGWDVLRSRACSAVAGSLELHEAPDGAPTPLDVTCGVS